MNTNFSDYANYYDLINLGKDYKKECEYVTDLLSQSKQPVLKIYDFGCGTGIHATEIAKSGYEVHGIDMSRSMISIAEAQKFELSAEDQDRLKFSLGDVRNYRGASPRDAVLSLFHVASYQVEDSDLAGYFNTASENLKPGGIFIFDYWHLPAMINLKPENRVKEVDGLTHSVRRVTTSSWLNQNVVSVKFNIFVKEKATQQEKEIQEIHNMRGLTKDIILEFMPKNLQHINTYSWLTLQEPSNKDWNAVSVFKKND
jgi:SAM-dependent methyltransferase